MRPASSPTTGPSRAPPTTAGMCIMVALPMSGIGTGMKPRRVAPKNNAMPPMMPATTTCRVLKPNADPPPPPPSSRDPIAMSACPSSSSLVRTLCRTCRVSAPVRIVSTCPGLPLQRRHEAAVGGRPPAVHHHQAARHVGAGLGGEVHDHADHLARLGPTPQHRLRRIGVIPVGVALYLLGERRLHHPRGDG